MPEVLDQQPETEEQQPEAEGYAYQPGEGITDYRDLPEDLSTPPPDYIAASERATFKGFRRKDGRVGTRNYVLIVPTSMCASHEATQIAMTAEITLYARERYPNVDGVVAIPHNKGCGCQVGCAAAAATASGG